MKERDRAFVRAIAVAAGFLTIAACAGGEASEIPATSEPQGRVVSVQTIEVQPQSFSEHVQIVGTIAANQDVIVSAEESGPIREILVDKGAVVSAGQPILRIDDSVLRPQAEQAAAEAALAEETWQRQKRLWEEDRVGSEMAYLQARYRAETAEAGARVLQERLARTTVRAPFAGILDSRMVEVGTLVAPGTPVARVIDDRRVKVTGGVPERFAGEIRRGDPVEIQIDGTGGEWFRGEIGFVGTAVDPSSRTFPIEVIVPNPERSLKPGMIANVRLTRREIPDAIVVPQESVLRVEDGYVVYVAVNDGDRVVAESRRVTLGPAYANRVVVQEGLEAGERVVTVGQARLAPGDVLEIVSSAPGRG